MEIIIFIIIGLFIYFIPTIIGWNTKYASGIFLLNFFLGWTILGWIAALIWSVSAPKGNKKQYYFSKEQKGNNNGLRGRLIAIKNVIFVSSDKKQYDNDEINQLLMKLNQGEAIIKNKLTNKYDIVTSEQWEKILTKSRQDEYEIIEEK